MILLPQYTPYKDPITILICGGTIPGPEIALDNCISTSPSLPSPVWEIERMPSQRVISCITALPDGTYLILNGAQQGRAGFGLANNPNFNAVLYDPGRPLHRRMSVMGNTTIARLYHSEAILMQDGRVLVSGSDPQEGEGAKVKFPEEYRVEIFVPPYILSGAPRPAFTIGNKDWAYAQAVGIQLTSFTSTANIKISLTGAEASTHGNNMGQRTIFPEFSCVGETDAGGNDTGGTAGTEGTGGKASTCTIIAPPTSRICPPGWFQLWVIDGGIPSHSQFVRIGGDSARLGEWPRVGGFKLPGV